MPDDLWWDNLSGEEKTISIWWGKIFFEEVYRTYKFRHSSSRLFLIFCIIFMTCPSYLHRKQTYTLKIIEKGKWRRSIGVRRHISYQKGHRKQSVSNSKIITLCLFLKHISKRMCFNHHPFPLIVFPITCSLEISLFYNQSLLTQCIDEK